MANQVARSEDFKTPPCRLSYTRDLFAARVQQAGRKPKFGCTLIFDNEHRAALGKLVTDVLVAEFGANAVERAKNGLLRSPLLAGDGKEARNKTTGEINPGLGADKFFIRVTANEDRPPVVRWKSQHVAPTAAEVYSGCYGFAVVNAYAYPPTDGGVGGVAIGVSYVQKTGEGDSLGGSGGGVDVDKYFEKVADAGPAPEATKTGDGASGLFA